MHPPKSAPNGAKHHRTASVSDSAPLHVFQALEADIMLMDGGLKRDDRAFTRPLSSPLLRSRRLGRRYVSQRQRSNHLRA